MEQNEPAAREVQCYEWKAEETLFVRDELPMDRHLDCIWVPLRERTSRSCWRSRPPVLFFPEVPDEIKAGVNQMKLDAQFSARAFGFAR